MLYDGRVTRVAFFLLSLLFFLSFFGKMPTVNAVGECTATIPPQAVAEETFNLTVTFGAAYSSGQAKFDVETKDGRPFSTLTTIFDRSSSPKNFPIAVAQAGEYKIIVRSLRPVQTLCESNIIDITPAPTPTPGGPGISPTTSAVNPVTLPASVPVATITPTRGPPAPPCLEGLSDPNNPESITKDKNLIKKCTKVDTAVGGVETDPANFIKRLYIVLLSMAGGWAVYLIITAGYHLMFSQGNPESVQEAREKITSAIVGLLFMILSVAILQVIGYDVFRLPGFAR